MSIKIEFISPWKEYIPAPKPSLYFAPKEYKDMSNYVDEKNKLKPTVKKCIPFLDSLTTGYCIPFPYDIHYWYDENNKKANFQLPEGAPEDFKVGTHDPLQVNTNLRYNQRTIDYVFKFANGWQVKTPVGYSCIFTTPFNRNFNFKLIDGVVDTDKYEQSVEFPFYWTSPYNKTVTLKRGDPMCLVIPFKRDSWTMKIVKESFDENEHKRLKFFKFFEDIYKRICWSKKIYK